MLIACLGDLVLDVVVDSPAGLVHDDDTTARIRLSPGGQAANVATWAAAYGARTRLFGPRADDEAGRIAEAALRDAGVEPVGPRVARLGTVMSLIGGGHRTLATDPGDLSWHARVAAGSWLEGADWLFVSGYALLRSPRPELVQACADAAHAAGTRVAVDLASAAMLTEHGPRDFRRRWRALRPHVVLANEAEWAATHADDDSDGSGDGPDGPGGDGFGGGGTSVLVLKQGSAGCAFVIDGVVDQRVPLAGPVVDATGAGDALAAGFLLGGVDLAMDAAARCVAQHGAQPARDGRPGSGSSRRSGVPPSTSGA